MPAVEAGADGDTAAVLAGGSELDGEELLVLLLEQEATSSTIASVAGEPGPSGQYRRSGLPGSGPAVRQPVGQQLVHAEP